MGKPKIYLHLLKICIVVLIIKYGGRGNGKTPYCP